MAAEAEAAEVAEAEVPAEAEVAAEVMGRRQVQEAAAAAATEAVVAAVVAAAAAAAEDSDKLYNRPVLHNRPPCIPDTAASCMRGCCRLRNSLRSKCCRPNSPHMCVKSCEDSDSLCR